MNSAWIIVMLSSPILFVTILLLMKVTISLTINISLHANFICLHIKTCFGLVNIKRKLDIMALTRGKTVNEDGDDKVSGEWDSSKNKVKSILKDLQENWKIVKCFFEKIQIHELEWRSSIGTGDAAISATLAGAVWSIKGIILTIIRSNMPMKRPPVVEVSPSYQRLAAETSIACMVKFRTGNAILTAIKLFLMWKKMKRHISIDRGLDDGGASN